MDYWLTIYILEYVFLKGHLKKDVFCEQKYGSHAEPDALNLC